MTTAEEQTCASCPRTFFPKVLTVLGKEVFRQIYCFKCVEEENARRAGEHGIAYRKHQAECKAAWLALCGPKYATIEEGGETVMPRLKRDCPKLDQVRAWKFGAQGLLVHGDTGRCKTRAVWRLLRDLWEWGRTIRAFTAGEFGRQYAEAAGNFTRAAWFTDLAQTDILFLDDFGKSEWTAGVWGEFFDLLETRMKYGRPCIITSNETGETIQRKAKDANTWQPLYRRIQEMEAIWL